MLVPFLFVGTRCIMKKHRSFFDPFATKRPFCAPQTMRFSMTMRSESLNHCCFNSLISLISGDMFQHVLLRHFFLRLLRESHPIWPWLTTPSGTNSPRPQSCRGMFSPGHLHAKGRVALHFLIRFGYSTLSWSLQKRGSLIS